MNISALGDRIIVIEEDPEKQTEMFEEKTFVFKKSRDNLRSSVDPAPF